MPLAGGAWGCVRTHGKDLVKGDAFIREVDEELRHERLLRLWKRFGPYLIALAVLIVLGTAAKVGYDRWRDKRMAEEADRFRAAELALARDPEEAAELWLELAEESESGLGVLARFRAAAALREAGRAEEALEVLRRAAETAEEELVRELARLLWLQGRLDRDPPEELVPELEALAGADRPFRHAAREMMAVAALRAGDVARARELLEELADDATVPESQRERVRELLELLGGGDDELAS